MFNTLCPMLGRLSGILRDAYHARTNALLGSKSNSGEVLFKAERDLDRAHRLIARHRITCPHCKRNEEQRINSRSPEVTPVNRVN